MKLSIIYIYISGTGPGVRAYKDNDTFKRKKWEGNFVSGSRHGEGKLYYTSGTGYWYGRWKDDKQHGLHAWIEDSSTAAEGKNENEKKSKTKRRPKIYLFRDDVQLREATDQDFEDPSLGIDAMSDEWRVRCKFPTKREAEEGTWCSSAKRENLTFIIHLLIALTRITYVI